MQMSAGLSKFRRIDSYMQYSSNHALLGRLLQVGTSAYNRIVFTSELHQTRLEVLSTGTSNLSAHICASRKANFLHCGMSVFVGDDSIVLADGSGYLAESSIYIDNLQNHSLAPKEPIKFQEMGIHKH